MQMPVMKQVLAAMNIPVYACEGWEADARAAATARPPVRGGRLGLRHPDGRPRQPAARRRARLRAPGAHAGRQTRTERYTPDVFRAEYGWSRKRLIDLMLLWATARTISRCSGVGPRRKATC